MALPSSGPISFAQIRDEFGLGNPTSASQWRGRGSAPTSGPVSISQLLGASALTFSVSPSSGSHSGNTSAQVQIVASSAVTWTWTKTGGNGGSTAGTTANGSTGTIFNGRLSATTFADAALQVTATSGSFTRTFTIILTCIGRGS